MALFPLKGNGNFLHSINENYLLVKEILQFPNALGTVSLNKQKTGLSKNFSFADQKK